MDLLELLHKGGMDGDFWLDFLRELLCQSASVEVDLVVCGGVIRDSAAPSPQSSRTQPAGNGVTHFMTNLSLGSPGVG